MNYKIIDNCLSDEDYNNLKNKIISGDFPWHLAPIVTSETEKLKLTSSYYFTHMIWESYTIDPNAHILGKVLELLDCKAVIRIKANLYPSTENIEYHQSHCDLDYEHKGAILYLNTNNGFTVLQGENDGEDVLVESIDNRLLLFDAHKPHYSTTCTDQKCRININFNYF